MDDLISREKVLEIIGSKLDVSMGNISEHQSLCSIWKSVKELPTAYDPDYATEKIGEKLREYSGKYRKASSKAKGIGFSKEEAVSLTGISVCRFAIQAINKGLEEK